MACAFEFRREPGRFRTNGRDRPRPDPGPLDLRRLAPEHFYVRRIPRHQKGPALFPCDRNFDRGRGLSFDQRGVPERPFSLPDGPEQGRGIGYFFLTLRPDRHGFSDGRGFDFGKRRAQFHDPDRRPHPVCRGV